MASSRRRRSSSVLLLKEGFLCKRGEIIKTWMRRYCALNPQCLCYFKNVTRNEEIQPLGRIFLDDIVEIETDVVAKKKQHCFALHTDTGHKRKSVYFQATGDLDRKEWIQSIKNAKEKEKKAEREDPFRKTLRKLTKGMKRVKLEKDPDKGIGCTIKNAAGLILVSRIIEDGPIAATGILKPGDEIVEIHGTAVTGKTVEEIVQIIRECPDEFLATVRPVVSVRKKDDPSIIEGLHEKTNYSKIVFPTQNVVDDEDIDEALDCVKDTDEPPLSPSPPPVPPHTKESYILLESVATMNGGGGEVRRKPHVYEQIDPKSPPARKTSGGGRVSPTRKISSNGKVPDGMNYADLDFRQ